jgi:sialate O-acetylesterase
MKFGLSGVNDAPAEIAAANYPNIRLFTVPNTVAIEPQKDTRGQWAECNPQTARNFSAVGYFFGRGLHQDLGVPIGLIHTSWGGTVAEAWTSREALAAHEELRPILERSVLALVDYPQALEEYQRRMAEWEARAYFTDSDNKGFGMGWAALDHDMTDWQPMELPGLWADAGLNIDGVVWFRKEITVPPSWVGKDLTLSLGPIDDCDTTYFNGVQVGATGMDTPECWQTPRRYTVPAELAKAGRAVVAVRVYDRWLNAGFAGVPTDMALSPVGGAATVSLAGPWPYKVEASRPEPNPPIPQPQRPLGPDNPNSPSGLYNAMISPLVPYAIKGAIWYQGESNAGRAYQYRTLFPTMIRNWREVWEQGDFPFLFVQLANFMAVQEQPAEDSAWAELREAQLMTLSLPNTGMAVIIDVGEADDIHPRNKQDVGARLALAARAVAYGQDIVSSGPIYDDMRVDGDRVVLSFGHVGGGLTARGGGPLTGFAICGPDRRFVRADARIRGDRVIVSSDEVPEPVAVRYGWANNPVCNLYNTEGLPASPFRTDDWPGVTVNNR